MSQSCLGNLWLATVGSCGCQPCIAYSLITSHLWSLQKGGLAGAETAADADRSPGACHNIISRAAMPDITLAHEAEGLVGFVSMPIHCIWLSSIFIFLQ